MEASPAESVPPVVAVEVVGGVLEVVPDELLHVVVPSPELVLIAPVVLASFIAPPVVEPAEDTTPSPELSLASSCSCSTSVELPDASDSVAALSSSGGADDGKQARAK